jgi:large subunit ribosomal protein L3
MSETAVQTPEKAAVPALKAIVGQKVGMTQIYDQHGVVVPVTVVLAGPCHVIQIMSKEKHGYEAIQIGYGDVKEKSLNKPMLGQFSKRNVPVSRWVREIRTSKAASFQVGQSIKADTFAPGDYVDVSGLSKGKGFAGAMKRHNFSGGPSTHGQSDRARAPGSSGSNTYPGRVFKGKKFPGHMGVEGVTVQHVEVIEVHPEKDLLLIRGALPGPKENLLMIRQTVKRVKTHVARVPAVSKKAAKKEAAKAAPAPAAAAKAKGAK